MKRIVKLIMIMILIGGITLTNNPFYIERRGAEYYIEWIGFNENKKDKITSGNNNQEIEPSTLSNQSNKPNTKSKNKSNKNNNNISDKKEQDEAESSQKSNDNWLQSLLPDSSNSETNETTTTKDTDTSSNNSNSTKTEANTPKKEATMPTSSQLREYESIVRNTAYNYLNSVRQKAGQPVLKVNDSMQQTAFIRCKELRTLYSHTRPDGTTVNKLGFGENITEIVELYDDYIAYDSTYSSWESIGEKIAKGWENSKGHYANIVNPSISEQGLNFYIVAEKDDHFNKRGLKWSVYGTHLFK